MKVISAKVSPIKTGGYVKNISLEGQTDWRGLFFGELSVRCETRGRIDYLNTDEVFDLHWEVVANIEHHEKHGRQLSDRCLTELYEMEIALATITRAQISWVKEQDEGFEDSYPIHYQPGDKVLTPTQHRKRAVMPSAPRLEDLQDLPPSYEEVVQDSLDCYLNN